MENDQPITEKQSLEIIHEMIHKAQSNVRDNSFQYLLWGWLVFIAAVSQYAMIRFFPTNLNGLPWVILMPLGGIISAVYGARERKKEKVKTYTGELLRYALGAFFFCLVIVLVFIPLTAKNPTDGWMSAYPMIMMVYGMWLFISGGALQFRPLIIGGLINFGCAIGGFYVHTVEMILLLAFAVLAGYIIPGHLLKAKYKKEKHEAV